MPAHFLRVGLMVLLSWAFMDGKYFFGGEVWLVVNSIVLLDVTIMVEYGVSELLTQSDIQNCSMFYIQTCSSFITCIFLL
jgi:hypothetical protein